jgi:hypothetical protein
MIRTMVGAWSGVRFFPGIVEFRITRRRMVGRNLQHYGGRAHRGKKCVKTCAPVIGLAAVAIGRGRRVLN